MAILLSSFIPALAVWVNLVYWPTAWLSRGVEWLFFLGEPPARSVSSDPRLSVSIAARLYFLVLVAAFTAVFSWLVRLRARRRRLSPVDPHGHAV
jgi:hypothetical protein